VSSGVIVAYDYGGEAAVAGIKQDVWSARQYFAPLADPVPPPIPCRAARARKPSAFPEIDCVRALLPAGLIAAAEQRAAAVGIGADRVLITADAITEDAYLAALSDSLGVAYEPFDDVSREDCPLDDEYLIQGAAAGLLPLHRGGDIVWVIAPRCLTARWLTDPRNPRPPWLRRFRLTSSERLRRFADNHTQSALGASAAEGLGHTQPLLSNAPQARRRPSLIGAILVALVLASVAVAPAVAIAVVTALLCVVFVIAAALRLASAVFKHDAPIAAARVDDSKLPIYTIICPLVREAAVIGNLVASIREIRDRGRRRRDLARAHRTRSRAAIRDHYRTGHWPAHQTEGAQRRTAVRARQLRRNLRRRRSPRRRSTSASIRCIQGGRQPPCLRAGTAHHR
jgi:hypothetical protein